MGNKNPLINIVEIEKSTELEVSSREKILETLENSINSIIISNEKEFGHSTDLLKKIKEQNLMIENFRKNLTKPINDFKKSIDAQFKPVADKATGIKVILEGKIKKYYELIEQERREKAEKERQRQIEIEKAEHEKKLAAMAFLAEEKEEIEEIEVEKEAQTQKIEEMKKEPVKFHVGFRSSNTATSFITVPKYEVVDSMEVPLEFQSPDHKKIMQALNLGIRTIRGLRIWEDKQIRSR